MPTADFSKIIIGGVQISCTDDTARSLISTLSDKIPSEVSSENPLTNKSYVDQKFSSQKYGDVNYEIQKSNNVNGNITIDGTKAFHILALSGNISSVTISPLPVAGHSTHVLFVADDEYNVIIGHNAISSICPNAEDIQLTTTAGGYVEVDFLYDGDAIYVRGV